MSERRDDYLESGPLLARGRACRASWIAGAVFLLVCLVSTAAWAQEWHELYADGQRALRDGQAQRAVDLLQRAILKRPAPGVSVPTYGTNFEPRYFPYLRLAEAYILLDDFEAARKALETSSRLGVEPAAERATLEARVRAALDAPDVKSPPAEAAHPSEGSADPSRDDATGLGSSETSSLATPPPPQSPRVPTPEEESAGLPSAITPSAGASVSSSTVRGDAGARSRDELRKETPALEIVSQPPGTQVFIDDELVGRTDPETGRLRLTSLRAGRHRIRLAAEGFDDVVREIDIAGKTREFRGTLTPLRKSASGATFDSAPGAALSPDNAAPVSSASRWPIVAIVVVAAGLALSLWVRNFSRSASEPARERTPIPTPAAKDPGTDEGLPCMFGDYRLLRRLGKGGMASVYEAERRGERFALKRPIAGLLDDPMFLERFLREAELGRALHHPNIVRIFDRGQVGATPYFAMELIDGETLRARLDLDGRIAPLAATRIVAQVAEALDYAHHKGVIHRDLKPSNIMLERSSGVKVMDYGIARAQHLEGVTTTGSFLGTPHYVAPETVEAATEPRSDIYSLGVVFFEMLTGSLPFRGENAFAVLRSHCVTPPPSPSSLNRSLSEELDRIVLRLLSKEPSKRPDAEELLNALSDYLRRANEAV